MRRLERIGIAVSLTLAAGGVCCLGQTKPAEESARQSAIALEQQGNDSEAEAAWRALLKMRPVNSEAYAHIGLLEARQQRYKEAVLSYSKALALNPAMPELRLNLGLALFKDGELKQAIQEFSPLLGRQLRTSAEGQRLVILIGMAHYGLREYAVAAPFLKEAATEDPQNLQFRMTLAHSCLWSKQYQCVLDAYHEILTLNAESAEADMLAGEALDEMKEYDGAILQFRAAVKIDPNEPDVHFGLGYLLWTQRQYEEAAHEFQTELVGNPNHVQALAYLADADIQMNHSDLARPLLEKVEKIDPALSLGHLDLGILYADAGRESDALRELNEAAKLAPEDVNVHWRLGRLYRSMGRKAEAKSEFDKASSLNRATDSALLQKMDGIHSQPAKTLEPGAAPSNK
jgi:tetratricopeptide (TPR) repeat protein